MSAMRFKKKINTVDAIQWTGANIDDVKTLVGEEHIERGPFNTLALIGGVDAFRHIGIGEFIVKDNGAIYAVSQVQFLRTYELAEPFADCAEGVFTEGP